MSLSTLASHLTRTDIAASTLLLTVLALWTRRLFRSTGDVVTTPLKGPHRGTGVWALIFGLARTLVASDDPAGVVEEWTKAHGSVFSIPVAFGRRTVMLVDVKAASHFLARDTGVYHQTALASVFIENLFGRGILWAEEDDHRRQRKALTPAFSLSATRSYLNTFYDSANKIKSNWESLLESGHETIEVQSWMNHASLDDLGIAGFGHDFHALDGANPDVIRIFEAFERPEDSSWISRILFLISPVVPALQRLPTQHNRMMVKIKREMARVADRLLDQGGERKGGRVNGAQGAAAVDKSIMGLLVKAEAAEGGLRMSEEEVLAQMNTLLFAGYETTSISLTWALIELCWHQDKQDALRKELSSKSESLGGADPTWEDLTTGLPYLNAVVHEVLRLHPPLPGIVRVASQDDVVPLSTPITTATGDIVSHLVIAKGTTVNCPVAYINQAEEYWGFDAKEFKPERWLDGEDGIGKGARGIQGYHHLLSFSDGPRLCIGRHFAIANFKATLSVLIRNFSFELPGGSEQAKVGRHKGILVRPKLEGETGPKVPLIVRRVESD